MRLFRWKTRHRTGHWRPIAIVAWDNAIGAWRAKDVNAGTVLDGTETVAQVGRRIFREMIAIASGEKPALAEEWRHTEFQIWSEDGIAL